MNENIILTTGQDIDSAEQLFRLLDAYEKDNKWIFRGQSNFSYGLKTSIERMFEEFGNLNISKTSIELGLVERFQREAHHYGIANLDFLNIPEWISLMQHYGAPTRLLDWTYSPWVGLFFAVMDLKKENDAALWIVNWNEIDSKANEVVKKIFQKDCNVTSINDFIEIINSGDGVIKLNSFKQNQRQIIQQGTFLFPINIDKSFEENMFNGIPNGMRIKLRLKSKIKSEVIKKLYRMNITYTTLFPGIEGFSKSLNHLHYIDRIFEFDENIKDYLCYKNKFEK
jgi:hypothetical protein